MTASRPSDFQTASASARWRRRPRPAREEAASTPSPRRGLNQYANRPGPRRPQTASAACSGPRFHHEAARSRRGWGRPRSTTPSSCFAASAAACAGARLADHIIKRLDAALLLVALLLLDLLDHVPFRGVRRVQIFIFAERGEPRLAPLPLIFKNRPVVEIPQRR